MITEGAVEPIAVVKHYDHPRGSRGDWRASVQEEVSQMISGQPLAQIAGQEHRRLPSQLHKTGSHAGLDPCPPFWSIYFQKSFAR